MKNQFDIIVIGSGVAGGLLARGLKAAGKEVAVIEEDLWGGTCPNRGCDPKKVLLSAVDAREAVAQLNGKGFNKTPDISWPELMAFKKSFTAPVPESTLSGFEEAGVVAIKGQAKFIDPNQIEVEGRTYRADQFVLATGQSPTIPEIEGKELLKNSNDFLALETLPKKIVFLGAGYIAFELAGIANACGAEVHVVHHNERPLKQFDGEFVDELVEQLKNSGVAFHFNEEAASVAERGSGRLVTLKSGKTMEADMVFATLGREPNIQSLELDNAGVAHGKNGVIVNGCLKTSCDHIYACGDGVDKKVPRLTPISSFEGSYLLRYLTGEENGKIDYPATPTVVFTSYRLGQVGVDTQTAQDNPDQYEIKNLDMTDYFNYKRRNEAVAKAKLIIEKETGLLAGAAVISQEADELINVFTLIVNAKISADKINGMIMLFPTVASDLSSLY